MCSPRGLGSNTIIDISKPNLEGLVSDHSAVQVSPVAKLQLEDVGFWTGRRVGMTSTYFAYALGKTKGVAHLAVHHVSCYLG
jgi:hypothetical protein